MVNIPNEYKAIGQKIKDAREAAGLSQKELAQELDYKSSTAISYIESGDRKVSVVDLEKISHFLDKDVRYFLGQEDVQLNIRVALRAEPGLGKKDQDAILHIIELAKKRARGN